METEGGIMGWIDTHPMTALAVALVVAIGLGTVVMKKSAPAAQPPTATGDLSGLPTDAAGNHIIYRDTGDQFINTSIIEGSYNTNALPGDSDHATAFVRPRFNSATTTDYDKVHSEGIPVRSSPGGAIVGSLAYGSAVSLHGPAIAGGSNFAGSAAGLGSTEWLPLASGGYVSAYDLTGYLNG